MTVALVVNCYERTYRQVLAPGYFPHAQSMNGYRFDEVVALINNVDDPSEARRRAEDLVRAGEITRVEFVADWIEPALRHYELPSRVLAPRPYLLDYGLVMPLVTDAEWVLGWDAETAVEDPHDWVTPSIEFMSRDTRVFHCSLNWPPARPQDAGVEGDAIASMGPFHLSWGFSDQVFLLRRSAILGVDYRTFSPAAIARHAPHPYTFEFRMESYQRARRKLRATYAPVTYRTNLDIVGVLERTGKGKLEDLRRESLHRLEYHVTRRLPSAVGPRFARNADLGQARP